MQLLIFTMRLFLFFLLLQWHFSFPARDYRVTFQRRTVRAQTTAASTWTDISHCIHLLLFCWHFNSFQCWRRDRLHFKPFQISGSSPFNSNKKASPAPLNVRNFHCWHTVYFNRLQRLSHSKSSFYTFDPTCISFRTSTYIAWLTWLLIQLIFWQFDFSAHI